MDIAGFRLETERLLLRPYAPTDIDSIAPILGDPETMSFYPNPFSRADSERWIANNIRRYEEDGHGLYVIEERETGAFLGNCGPVRQLVDGASEVELGWHVKRDRWSQGIASEAATACSDHARRDLGLGRLISLILPANMASRRVAEKIGMTVEKETVWGPKAQPHLVYSLRMD